MLATITKFLYLMLDCERRAEMERLTKVINACGKTVVVYTRDFNPRSRKGSDLFGNCISRQRQNFNPRSRKGSDDPLVNYDLTITISIHAPARGATTVVNERQRTTPLFQSTLPQGERHYSIVPCTSMSAISIHAPARGATSAA